MRLGLIVVVSVCQGISSPALAEDHEPPRIRHTPVLSSTPGKPIEISARITDDLGEVAFPRVYFRRVGETKYSVVTLRRAGERYAASIPTMAVTTDGVEYYIEAFDSRGNGPAQHGSAEAPHRVEVAAAASRPARPAPPATRPWYTRWWVWTLVGGVVVAGTVTAVAVAVTGDDDGGDGVGVEVSAPLPSPTLPGL